MYHDVLLRRNRKGQKLHWEIALVEVFLSLPADQLGNQPVVAFQCGEKNDRQDGKVTWQTIGLER